MSQYEGRATAYPVESIVKQKQQLPGLDAKMNPTAHWTKVEKWDDDGNPYLEEYTACGRLKGKAVLITGGDSGIGRSAALLMAREGANVSIVYIQEEEQDATDTAHGIEHEGQQCLKLCLDLRANDSCERAISEHMKRWGRLDVLVNNSARQVLCDKIDDIDLDNVKSTYDLNILAMYALCKFAVPHMKRGSSIINSGSVAGYMSNPMLVDYTGTKGAIASFTRALGLQLGPRGIRVNSVVPGIIYTPLQPATNDPDTMQAIGKGQPPVGRPAHPAEVGPWYVFLAGPEGSYMTGQSIHVNGGLEVQS